MPSFLARSRFRCCIVFCLSAFCFVMASGFCCHKGLAVGFHVSVRSHFSLHSMTSGS